MDVVGVQVAAGMAYRTGKFGATVRFLSGAVRRLRPDRIFLMHHSGEVTEGDLTAKPNVILTRRRHRYADKQMRAGRNYADKSL